MQMEKLREEKVCDRTEQELWLEYRKTRDPDIRERIALYYLDTVQRNILFMAKFYHIRQVDDLIQEGVVALLTCIDKYDPEKKVSFSDYIKKRIKGVAIDWIRSQRRISRRLLEKQKQKDKAQELLTHQFGRMPTDQEMADYFNISLEKYLKSYKNVSIPILLSLDATMENTYSEAYDLLNLQISTDNLEGDFLRKELYGKLTQGIQTLTRNEQLVLALYYQEDLNEREVAEVMCVSEPRISQLHTAAVRKLRLYLEKEYN